MLYIVVILLLYCCYIVVILLLYCCYIVVILLLYCCYIVVILLLYCCYIVVILLLYCCYIVVILLLYCYYILLFILLLYCCYIVIYIVIIYCYYILLLYIVTIYCYQWKCCCCYSLGDPHVNWEESVYLNMIMHDLHYTLTCAICVRMPTQDLKVLCKKSLVSDSFICYVIFLICSKYKWVSIKAHSSAQYFLQSSVKRYLEVSVLCFRESCSVLATL